MHLRFIAFILTFFTSLTVYCQSKGYPCNCPKTQYTVINPDTVYHLTNGNSIVLCGYKNPGTKPATFSEFVLAVCGQDSIIDFWGAVLTCRLQVNKDSLFVYRLENLPTGKDFEYQEVVWTTEKIHLSKQKVVRKLVVNRQIKRYNQNEIKVVLKSYEKAGKGLDDSKMEIANKLFVASISGDKTAQQYFKDFKIKFAPLDGAFAEEYNDLSTMLRQWYSKN